MNLTEEIKQIKRIQDTGKKLKATSNLVNSFAYNRVNIIYDNGARRKYWLENKDGDYWPFNKEEYNLWLGIFDDSNRKQEKKLRTEIKKEINETLEKKILADPAFKTIKVTRSAYEKALYASKKVSELFGTSLELLFVSLADINSNVINDFYIPYQGVTDTYNSEASDPIIKEVFQAMNKKRIGIAHSHGNKYNTLHSDPDVKALEDCAGGLKHKIDLTDKKRGNLKFEFDYGSSLVFNGEMLDNKSIKPSLGLGIRYRKFDEGKGGITDIKHICLYGEKSSLSLEIIEDNEIFDRAIIDKELKAKVKICKNGTVFESWTKNNERSYETDLKTRLQNESIKILKTKEKSGMDKEIAKTLDNANKKTEYTDLDDLVKEYLDKDKEFADVYDIVYNNSEKRLISFIGGLENILKETRTEIGSTFNETKQTVKNENYLNRIRKWYDFTLQALKILGHNCKKFFNYILDFRKDLDEGIPKKYQGILKTSKPHVFLLEKEGDLLLMIHKQELDNSVYNLDVRRVVDNLTEDYTTKIVSDTNGLYILRVFDKTKSNDDLKLEIHRRTKNTKSLLKGKKSLSYGF